MQYVRYAQIILVEAHLGDRGEWKMTNLLWRRNPTRESSKLR